MNYVHLLLLIALFFFSIEFHFQVLDPVTMLEVPADGVTVGEVMVRGNVVMKGYLSNEAATR